MATKIVTKNSSTASAVPTASDLVQGELAVNVADKRLFTEDNAGAIVELGTNPSALTVTGEITANGGIALGDNDKATFGASDDLQIYHDGSASRIVDSGTGGLTLQADANVVIQNSAGTETKAEFTTDGGVNLYYDNAAKLATTSTGIDVTGNLTMASGGSIVAGGANDLILNAGESGTPDIYLQSGGSTKVKIEGSDGSVGIGAGSPSKGLHLNFSNDLAAIRFQNTANAKVWDLTPSIPDVANSGFSLHNVTDNTVPLHVDNSGNVGIGTSSPSAPLSFGANIPSNGQTLHTYHSGNIRSGLGIVAGVHRMFTNSTSALSFGEVSESDGSTYTERMRIGSSGNVGIGISNPSDYYTNFNDLVLGNTSGHSGMTIASGTTHDGTIAFADGTSGTAEYEGYIQYNHEVNTLTFGTDHTTRMVIDSSGRLGLGVTPEAWSSVFKVLRVGTGSSIAGESGGTSTWFNTNTYYDGSWKRINTNTAAQIAHTSDGKQEFKVAASGSANSAISWNTAMTVANSGDVLVGATASIGGARFNVEHPTDCIGCNLGPSASGNRYFMYFTYNGTNVGSIRGTSTATTYNTSSDQRLKENIADADDAGSKIDAIQVRQFDWKADGSHQDYGMIAQELQAVAPEAVSVPEDSEDMMGVDYSKLVPMLIKEIQSLRNRVAQLEE